jgi:hypothetical protein
MKLWQSGKTEESPNLIMKKLTQSAKTHAAPPGAHPLNARVRLGLVWWIDLKMGD